MRISGLVLPGADDVIEVRDAIDLDVRSRANPLPSDLAPVRYRLYDRDLVGASFAEPIAIHSRINVGSLHLTRVVERFDTHMDISGPGLDRYWFGLVNEGSLAVRQGAYDTTASGSVGLALRGLPGTGVLSLGGGVRTNLWIDADAMERALAQLTDDGPAGPIAFHPTVDWSGGLAASLVGLMDYLTADMRRADGLASNPVTAAAFDELVLRTILVGLPHDRSGRLARDGDAASPSHLRRAEDYMRAHADRPLRMAEVAAAAGCSLRTLDAAFSRHRGTTPLATLRALRLDRVREILGRGGGEAVGDVARRFGFSNAGRFAAAYRRRFGEAPSSTARLLRL